MAVGAAFLARRKAIVQKLTAIESLAGVDILCTDKTGTLTANQLSVHERMYFPHLELHTKSITDDGLAWAVEGVDLDWMCVT
jgi:H+-transporting ATPase